MRCVEIESEPYGKANYYKEAAYLIKAEGTDANKFVRLANEAIELYSIAGRSGGAANLAKECAEKLEEEFDLERAA
jgi:hypothetical protein